MKIGFTYDLRKDYLRLGFTEEETAEFDSEETIDYLASAIAAHGHEVDRIGNIYSLVERLSRGGGHLSGNGPSRLSGGREYPWDLVFNITEGLYGRSREAQVPALLEAYNIPVAFSDALTLALTLDKTMTKRVVRDAGIPTADFGLIEGPEDIEGIDMDFPLFLKPNCEGTGKGVTPDSLVGDFPSFRAAALRLLERYSQPVLVEEYLPGREFTVGILGTGKNARSAGVLEVTLLDNAEPFAYSYINKELCEEKVLYTLVRDEAIVAEASEVALAAYRVLGLRDAGRVDLRADANGKLKFLEVNPLPGLHPTHSDLPILCIQAGMTYGEMIGEILASARGRTSLINRADSGVASL